MHLALVFQSLNFLFYIGQRFRQQNLNNQFIAKLGSLATIIKKHTYEENNFN